MNTGLVPWSYQTHLQNFDAVVGDVSIVANRTSYIDYTLPYTESGASLLVPLKDPIKRSPLIFFEASIMDALALHLIAPNMPWLDQNTKQLVLVLCSQRMILSIGVNGMNGAEADDNGGGAEAAGVDAD
ncbi:hypothetical protein QQ045_030616 [Rhodiola kirilowii]